MACFTQPINASEADLAQASFVIDLCLPSLLTAQSADGGWGFRPGARSRVEPTAWVLVALAGQSPSKELANAIARGLHWLLGTQHSDGSWPASPGQPQGCWVTSLACLALRAHRRAEDAVAKGALWLCNAWPGEGSLWWRVQQRLGRQEGLARQNSSLRGWSWTPDTSSWVEPTAWALILLRGLPESLLPRAAARRRQLGVAMLYDRMCPGGGWNCGNPVVYGVPGEPQVGPTVWALLALQDYPERAENRKSLEWLETQLEGIRGASSLGLAHLCLRTYGRNLPPLEPDLRRSYARNQFLHNVLTGAWVTLALSPLPDPLGWTQNNKAQQ